MQNRYLFFLSLSPPPQLTNNFRIKKKKKKPPDPETTKQWVEQVKLCSNNDTSHNTAKGAKGEKSLSRKTLSVIGNTSEGNHAVLQRQP
jgi:hypothetical protein